MTGAIDVMPRRAPQTVVAQHEWLRAPADGTREGGGGGVQGHNVYMLRPVPVTDATGSGVNGAFAEGASSPMKHSVLMIAGFFVAVASAAAQPPPAGQQLTLTASLNRGYNSVKLNLTEEAAKMPEADYGFKPGSAAELRTYGQLFAHVAGSQFGSCAAALGQPNPNQGHNLEQELKTKAEFQKALADSFALCDKAFAALTDANGAEMVKQGQGEIARAALLANVVAHSNEMYGTGAVYMRAKGLVPPSTERATAAMPARPAQPGQ